jgi:hypothetical protein
MAVMHSRASGHAPADCEGVSSFAQHASRMINDPDSYLGSTNVNCADRRRHPISCHYL